MSRLVAVVGFIGALVEGIGFLLAWPGTLILDAGYRVQLWCDRWFLLRAAGARRAPR